MLENSFKHSEIRIVSNRRRPKVQPFHTPPFPKKVRFLKILSLFVSLSVARFHRETTLRTPRQLPDTAISKKVLFVKISVLIGLGFLCVTAIGLVLGVNSPSILAFYVNAFGYPCIPATCLVLADFPVTPPSARSVLISCWSNDSFFPLAVLLRAE